MIEKDAYAFIPPPPLQTVPPPDIPLPTPPLPSADIPVPALSPIKPLPVPPPSISPVGPPNTKPLPTPGSAPPKIEPHKPRISPVSEEDAYGSKSYSSTQLRIPDDDVPESEYFPAPTVYADDAIDYASLEFIEPPSDTTQHSSKQAVSQEELQALEDFIASTYDSPQGQIPPPTQTSSDFIPPPMT